MEHDNHFRQTWCRLAFVLHVLVFGVLLAAMLSASMSGGALGLTKGQTTLLLWSLAGATLASTISQFVMNCPVKNQLVGLLAFTLSFFYAIAQVAT